MIPQSKKYVSSAGAISNGIERAAGSQASRIRKRAARRAASR
jgi:hypothetical protein